MRNCSRYIALLAFAIAMVATNVAAMDPVTFIVQHNEELKLLKQKASWWAHIQIKTEASQQYGTTYTEVSTGSALLRQGTSSLLRITAEMPIISPQETIQAKLDAVKYERQLRTEAARAISELHKIRSMIAYKRQTIIDKLELIKWMEKRYSIAAATMQEIVNMKLETKKLIAEERELEASLEAAIEAVLSYVPVDKRDELRKMLD